MRPVALVGVAALAVGCAGPPPEDEVVPVPAPSARRATVDETREYRPGLSMDIYRPLGGRGRFPVVLLLHGGGWRGGSRQEMSTIGRAFTNEGMVAVSADYRLVPGARWPAQRDDVAAAVAYLRKHAEELSILPGRIGAAGVSAGGHLSATLGVRHPKVPPISRVQAVGSISGIHDLAAPLTTDGNSFRIVENLLGEGGEPDLDARREGSPVTYVDANAAPTFFVVGGRDDLVPRAQAELMERRLRAAGVEAEILDIPTMGHVPDLDRPEDLRAMRELARWMRRQLTAPSR